MVIQLFSKDKSSSLLNVLYICKTCIYTNSLCIIVKEWSRLQEYLWKNQQYQYQRFEFHFINSKKHQKYWEKWSEQYQYWQFLWFECPKTYWRIFYEYVN